MTANATHTYELKSGVFDPRCIRQISKETSFLLQARLLGSLLAGIKNLKLPKIRQRNNDSLRKIAERT